MADKRSHYNYSTTSLEGRVLGVVSGKKKIPLKVIRKWERRDDRLAMKDGDHTFASCAKCGKLHSTNFMRLKEGGWNAEDQFWCLDCLRPVED
jgi:hypothetical protein